MKISDNTSIAMPMRNLISIVVAVAVGVWAYFGIVERINTLETSKQLMEADLLKKAEQTPKNLEMLMLIEMNAKILEKLNAKTLEKTIVNLIKNSDRNLRHYKIGDLGLPMSFNFALKKAKQRGKSLARERIKKILDIKFLKEIF